MKLKIHYQSSCLEIIHCHVALVYNTEKIVHPVVSSKKVQNFYEFIYRWELEFLIEKRKDLK